MDFGEQSQTLSCTICWSSTFPTILLCVFRGKVMESDSFSLGSNQMLESRSGPSLNWFTSQSSSLFCISFSLSLAHPLSLPPIACAPCSRGGKGLFFQLQWTDGGVETRAGEMNSRGGSIGRILDVGLFAPEAFKIILTLCYPVVYKRTRSTPHTSVLLFSCTCKYFSQFMKRVLFIF